MLGVRAPAWRSSVNHPTAEPGSGPHSRSLSRREVLAIFTIVSDDDHVAITDVEIGARLKALLEVNAMDQRGLAERIGLSPSAMSRVISGERTLKAREVALIAEQLNVPVASIVEGALPPSPVAVAARQSHTDTQSVGEALARAAFFVELAELAESTQSPEFDWLELPTTGMAWQQGHYVAEQVLDHLHLDDSPLPAAMHDLAGLIESAVGVQVALEPLGNGMDGMSVSCARLKLAMVSTTTAPARQRWTLAHELAHLVLGDTQDLLVDRNVWGHRSPQESRANAFAAAFLMPSELVKREWGSAVRPSQDLVSRLLDTFHISLDALAFRVHNLGLVNAAGRDSIRSMYPIVSLLRNQGNRQSEGSWLPGQLTTDVIDAYAGGRIGVRWLANLVRLDPDELLRRLSANDEEAQALEAAEDEVLV